MLIKGCNEEDFTNYKVPSMFLIFPWCDFKCDKHNGTQLCQNWSLSKQQPIDVDIKVIVNHYINNPITKAIVFGGLEPFNSWDDLKELVKQLREKTDDFIVIYTGYRKDEIIDKIDFLKQYKNIVIKFGRFRPNEEKHFDDVLGVYLANNEQYAEVIS